MSGRIAALGRALLDRPPRDSLRALARRLGWAEEGAAAGPTARGFAAAGLAADRPDLDAEDWFVAAGGTRVPVGRRYRYGVKPAWRNFASLSALAQLDGRGLLDAEGRALLRAAIGTRTLTRPVAEIDRDAAPILARHAAQFLPETLAPGRFPALRPDAAEVAAAVAAQAETARRLLRRLARDGIFRPRPRPRALEVGAGGGRAAAALARLGFEVVALDSDYGGAMDSGRGAARAVAATTGGGVEFAAHDITRRTPFADGWFDLVCSTSVLEHIPDLPAALAEMRRLAAPGGALVHRYNPYFGFNGGHAFGTLDAPWAHVRLAPDEVAAYLDRLRPHEAALARPWIAAALTRDWPIARVQGALAAAGLALREWEEVPAPPARLAELSAAVLRECLAAHPGLALADLVAVDVAFVATPLA